MRRPRNQTKSEAIAWYGWKETEDDCWEFAGARNDAGYGRFRYANRNLPASRVSYEVFRGSIPEGLVVRHLCDNPPCVNPSHLVLGTQWDNIQDQMRQGRHTSQIRKEQSNGF